MGCCMRKKCGVHLTIAGCVLALLGIAVAFILPKIIVRQMKDNTCVNSPSHSSYDDWVGDVTSKSGPMFFNLWHWNITNVNGFLYQGETPKVKQVGPYVYRFAQKKLKVQFSATNLTVKYITMVQMEFDGTRTKSKCQHCTEHDQLTVANMGYLGVMRRFGGDMGFALSFLPGTVAQILIIADLVTSSRQGTFTALGQFNTSFIPHVEPAFPSGWGRFEFAQWLTQQNTSTNSPLFGVLSRLNVTSFTHIEMAGLYGVLTDPVKLGVTGNPVLSATCRVNVTTTGCGFLSYINAFNTRTATLVAANQAANISSDVTLLELSNEMQLLFCVNTTTACIQLDQDLLAAIVIYVTQHLPTLVIHMVIDQYNYGVVTTRPQSELAIGYLMEKLKVPGLFPNGVPAPGLARNDTSEEAAKQSRPTVEFYTCDHETKQNQWAGLGGSAFIDSKAYSKLITGREVSGYNIRFIASTSLSMCYCEVPPLKTSYQIFNEKVQVKFNIVHTGTTKLHGLYLHRYELAINDTFAVNNASIFNRGMVNGESLVSAPVVVSLPHFLGADRKFANRFNMKPNEKKHSFTFDIEPMTGIGFHIVQRMQFNVYIPREYIAVQRATPYNLTYTTESAGSEAVENVIPVGWIEVDVAGTKGNAKKLIPLYSVLIGGCGGVVGFVAFGGLLILGGLFVIIKLMKNRSKVDAA